MDPPPAAAANASSTAAAAAAEGCIKSTSRLLHRPSAEIGVRPCCCGCCCYCGKHVTPCGTWLRLSRRASYETAWRADAVKRVMRRDGMKFESHRHIGCWTYFNSLKCVEIFFGYHTTLISHTLQSCNSVDTETRLHLKKCMRIYLS